MSFTEENGYLPGSISSIMDQIRQGVNDQFGQSYTAETFVGTGFYKFYYPLVQKLQQSEIKTSEIFLKLQQYFRITNERISRPVVTNPGLIAKFEAEGFVASVKATEVADAGEIFICVELDDMADDYPAKKLEVAEIIKDSTVAGCVTQGAESTTLVLSNGQSFDFKFDLPNRIETFLKLTLTLSDNNQLVIGDPDEVKLKLLSNIAQRYRLGRDFEPQRYFERSDAPWTSQILLEYSFDDVSYVSTVYDAEYDDLLEFDLARVEIVEN